ncbi:MAG: serine/threonine-protein kinase [Polyangiales bacterium]
MLSLDSANPAELAPGARLGPYVVVRTLGVGGFGVVYEARHGFTQARVALKVLHPQYAHDPRVRARFLREARAAADVRHPHVVEIYEVGEAPETVYIAMRYLEGPSLAAQIDAHGAMPLADALDVMLPVLSAVQAAHDVGIIHRDLKPDNVVLAREDQRLHPTLLDFGIAKVSDASVAMTQTNMVFGTAHYMSPEQARDTKTASVESDVWSLGVMLFECVTGEVPWPGDSLVAVQIHMLEHAEVSARAKVPTLPEAFDEALRGALRRNAAERYPSVRAFALALLPFARASARLKWSNAFGASRTDPEGETPTAPIPAPPLTATPGVEVAVAHPAPRRSRSLFVPAALAGLVLTAGLVGAWRVLLPPPPPASAPAPPRAAVSSPAPPASTPRTEIRPAAPPPSPPPAPPSPAPVAARVAVDAGVAVVEPPRVRRPTEGRAPRRRPRTGVPIL